MQRTISPDVLEVLKASKIEGNTLTLPGQLDRHQYTDTMLVIDNAGGKWSKKAKCHIFASNPKELLGMLESGKTESMQQKLQAFFTPRTLAVKIAEMADVKDRFVLEPSAGEGALAMACKEAGALKVLCYELNPNYVKVLKAMNFDTDEGDFLTYTPMPTYERIVMNPPFTKNQDIKHVNHALKFLDRGGRLVAIMAGNTKRPWFDKLRNCEFGRFFVIEELPSGTFKESGTDVKTVIVTIQI